MISALLIMWKGLVIPSLWWIFCKATTSASALKYEYPDVRVPILPQWIIETVPQLNIYPFVTDRPKWQMTSTTASTTTIVPVTKIFKISVQPRPTKKKKKRKVIFKIRRIPAYELEDLNTEMRTTTAKFDGTVEIFRPFRSPRRHG